MATYKVIGQPAARVDGPDKVTGQATYAFDVTLPGMLWGKALRCPFPHARIVRIDTTAASALPGVHAVITGEDVRGQLQGREVRDVPVLCWDVARFAGDRVAAVAARDEEIAQRALDLIEVEYEELTPLLDPLTAMEPDAPLVHPDMLTYAGYDSPVSEPSNVFFSHTYGMGNVDDGFALADQIFEDAYTTARTSPAFFEPRTAVVWAEPGGRVRVWAANKAPHGLKQNIAQATSAAKDDILVEPTYVGGDFGSKAPPYDETLCYELSVRTGRPVKMVMDQVEEFSAGNPRHASIIRVRTGVKNDGAIVAHDQTIILNSGAYAGMMPRGFLAGVDRIAGNFRIPHARFVMHHVYTNAIPGGYLRGPGEAQGTFAMESHLDEVARRMGLDPVEFRLKNILRPGDRTPMNEDYGDIRAEETLRAALDATALGKPRRPNVGVGLSMCSRPAGGGETYANVTVQSDGGVLLETPIFEQGNGVHTIFAQVAGEVLGTAAGRVRVRTMDTDAVPNDSGVAGSRVTRMAIPAVHDAAAEARDRLLALASELTGWPQEQLAAAEGTVRRNDTGESMTWEEIVGRVPDGEIVGKGYWNQRGRPEVTAFAAQVAEVEVDPETGAVTLLSFTSVHDVGTVFNHVTHQGQINGAVVMGMGYALLEDLVVEDGQVATRSFADFKVPSMADLPPMRTVLLPGAGGTGPYNAKAIGEVPLLGVAPAIANAIRDATGLRIRDLPLSAERVRAGLL